MLKPLVLLALIVQVYGCYFNAECPYGLFASKTPYDTIRGDIRDQPVPNNCQAVSVWSLHRHGNRNPGKSVTVGMQLVASMKNEIIASYEAGNSQLCAQDIDNFKVWAWNETLETSQSYLTGTGYEELYDIGSRIREKYPHLLQGTADQFYFRPTNEQRTITSCMAFAHGLTDGVNLNVTVDDALLRDDVIRPYENCDRYQQDVKGGQPLADQLDSYFKSPEFVAVQNAVQRRLGISTKLDADNIFSMYELCRFYRSWATNLQSPWCAPFTNEDLVVLEYYDDVRHYHRNGYGSWVNVNLGKTALKDLFERFEAVVQGEGTKVVSYFTHDTMLEMVWCALGLYKDAEPLQATDRNVDRLWRSSKIGAFSVNMIAVLNSCTVSDHQHYGVQIYINEMSTPICPPEGCTWDEFRDKFEGYTASSLEFCSMEYEYEPPVPAPNSAAAVSGFWRW
ncbi:multiple inositol polyphosphate phosphatase 1-like [Anticarsia gemmatalis]|uniref:multiple inositol polyphosphate phosphatase 1-like n=1 Tax=Anticarsia gemmatalis TaxID=129554 RepID=UPI003F76CBCF